MAYAETNKNKIPLIEEVLTKAALTQGLTHREAALLLACDNEELNQRMYTLASSIKERISGNRIVMFAPLYLSTYCINGCTYCPYHATNKTIERRTLPQE